MKAFLLLVFAVFLVNALYGQTWTVQAVVNDIHWQNVNEWDSDVQGNLLLNGVLQSPCETCTYTWYSRRNGVGDYSVYTSGEGVNRINLDGNHNDYYQVYAVIVIPGVGAIQSNILFLDKDGDPEQAYLFARREDGSELVGFSADSIGLWTGYVWMWKPPGYSSLHLMSNGEPLKVRPNTIALSERFHRGASRVGDVRYMNYDNYPIYYV